MADNHDATDADPPSHPDPELRDEIAPQARARALQSLLTEQGILSTDAVDEVIATYEGDVGPMNGARVVARAWTDPEYREWLLDDGIEAVADLDISVNDEVMELRVIENSEDTHNVVVCTLCSCYPWAVLGLPPTWYKSPAYRSRVVDEPRALLREEFDTDLDDSIDVEVWDSNSEVRYMVLPEQPKGTEDMDKTELAELVSRNAMIGVERLGGGGAIAADGGARAEEGAATAGTAAPPDTAAKPVPRAGSAEEPTFAEPWMARSFALAVALTDEDEPGRAWDDFRARLVAELDADPGAEDGSDADYYGAWLAALERFLVDRDLVDADAFTARAGAFADGQRNAHEFVEGDPHAHADRLPEGHADGAHHHHADGDDHSRTHGHGHTGSH
ncbi:nitrile hydratase subunit alpha [Halobaculum gomorrense]|uniref:Nitrile hydratase, alpha subunit/nitrile hydratase accessory protein,TIGR03889 n=1 Tax=Halobaculum gomorrense TaxID=43928 RepID=A0A1M5MX11_9EURY|nr:nitrile hydratase subunit alpha [Halobaculum gomorrense]SHG81880.1 nitrile hydratase, alpha subunit/nitrile hydratase accessory protein,TIGR03889 [Halobaculum gomorrense]